MARSPSVLPLTTGAPIQQEFYVSPNGWVGFSTGAGSIVSCNDYGSSGTPNNFIGGFGGDRAVYDWDGGSIAYKLFGSAPNRRLVVQFTNMRYHYYSSDRHSRHADRAL